VPAIAERLLICCREISASLGLRAKKKKHLPSALLQRYGN
jgi:hypothetical protein